MGFVQSQEEKEKKAESGEKTGFKSEVILIASLLSCRNLILYTDFYAQRRYCLFSTESERNYNSQWSLPRGRREGCRGIAASRLPGSTFAAQEQREGMVWQGQKMGARAGPRVTLLSSAEPLLNQPSPPRVSGMPADPKPELHPGWLLAA